MQTLSTLRQNYSVTLHQKKESFYFCVQLPSRALTAFLITPPGCQTPPPPLPPFLSPDYGEKSEYLWNLQLSSSFSLLRAVFYLCVAPPLLFSLPLPPTHSCCRLQHIYSFLHTFFIIPRTLSFSLLSKHIPFSLQHSPHFLQKNVPLLDAESPHPSHPSPAAVL